jgi:hypothetical protein
MMLLTETRFRILIMTMPLNCLRNRVDQIINREDPKPRTNMNYLAGVSVFKILKQEAITSLPAWAAGKPLVLQ